MRYYDRAILSVIALSLAIIAGHLTFGDRAEAEVAGMNWAELSMNSDFEWAVEDIVEDCTVSGDAISC